MSNQPTSARLQLLQQPTRRLPNGLGINDQQLAQRVRLGLLTATLGMLLPGALNAAPVPTGGALLQPIPFHDVGRGATRAGVFGLTQSPRPDWITGLVEFLSAVPPECSSVSKKNTEQKCQQRERGVLERFKERHPVAFNLLVAGLTLLAGFNIGGGFQGGKR